MKDSKNTKAKRLNYAMIGGSVDSFIGPIHRMAIAMDDLADLKAGCFSARPERNAATGAALRLDPARVYTDWRALLAAERGKVDFVSVCTPNDSHFEIACAAMEAGFDVLCEKPLAMTAAEAATLEKVAKRTRRIVGIPFTYSGNPLVKLARELIAKGELGAIAKVVVEYQQGSFRKIDLTRPLDRRNAWKMNPQRSGPSGVLADIGVHGFHLIEYVTGLEVKELLADVSSYAPGNRLEDDASVLMRLKGKKLGRSVPTATMVTSKVATGEENGVRIRVYGEKASLFWDQENCNVLSVKYPFGPERIYKRANGYVTEASALAAKNSRLPAGHPEGFLEAFANIYNAFGEAVRTRHQGDCPSPHDGVRTMRFVDAALASAKRGGVWTKV